MRFASGKASGYARHRSRCFAEKIATLRPDQSSSWSKYVSIWATSSGAALPFTLFNKCRSASRYSSFVWRSEEHTSELQSQSNLVCRLLLEKKRTATQVATAPCETTNANSA